MKWFETVENLLWNWRPKAAGAYADRRDAWLPELDLNAKWMKVKTIYSFLKKSVCNILFLKKLTPLLTRVEVLILSYLYKSRVGDYYNQKQLVGS
jgi:hypothetical protein